MTKEQHQLLTSFRKTYESIKEEPLLIYGTGANAENIINICSDYNIIGVMDVVQKEKMFCGLPVLGYKEVENSGLKRIIVIARPVIVPVIYRRLEKWLEAYDAKIYDVNGNNIAELVNGNIIESKYFELSYNDIREKIRKYDAISFDIFDTLLMRKCFEPRDVFKLVEKKFEKKLDIEFASVREKTEIQLRKKCIPTIYQIYEQIAIDFKLENSLKEQLMNCELEYELKVLCPRRKVVELYKYAISLGKKVYIVSDMYLPKKIMIEMLRANNIDDYKEIFISCDYQVEKSNGLFKELKKIETGKILHIGDNEEADYIGALKSGIDAIQIYKATQMLENSTYRELLSFNDSLESNILIGEICSQIFNDPFSLYHSQGKPCIDSPHMFGYSIMAPFILPFILWMIKRIDKSKSCVLFSARDGWIIEKLYEIFDKKWKMELPRHQYLLTSRKSMEKILIDSDEKKRYLDYLSGLKIDSYNNLYFYDFMCHGTCQTLFEKLTGIKLHGLYLQKSSSKEKSSNEIAVDAFFPETSAVENNRRIFILCDFLECIFTNYESSFLGFDSDMKAILDEEKRTIEQIECLKKIHAGILEFCTEFSEILEDVPQHVPTNDFSDFILKYISGLYSNINIPELNNFILDDPLGGDKNTGVEALL